MLSSEITDFFLTSSRWTATMMMSHKMLKKKRVKDPQKQK